MAMTHYLNKIGDFFSMTRRERIGTLVVAALLALAVAAAVAVKHCARSSSLPAGTSAQIEQFKQQVAITEADTTRHNHHKEHKHAKKSPKESKKSPKDSKKTAKPSAGNAPNRLDEVPSF